MSKYAVDPRSAYDISVEINRRARNQYISDLSNYGAETQAAILRSSTGLSNINKYLTDTFENPVPTSVREGYQDYVRSAQSARGFGGSGSGETGEEARFLFSAGERRRQETLPIYQTFSQGLLGMSGLQGPQLVDQNTVFQQKLQSNAMDLQAAQFSHAKTMGYINAGIGVAGLALGGVGQIASAYNAYGQGQTARQNYAANQQIYQSPLWNNFLQGNQSSLQPRPDKYV